MCLPYGLLILYMVVKLFHCQIKVIIQLSVLYSPVTEQDSGTLRQMFLIWWGKNVICTDLSIKNCYLTLYIWRLKS